MNQDNKIYYTKIYLSNDICDALIAYTRQDGNTHHEEVFFRLTYFINQENNKKQPLETYLR